MYIWPESKRLCALEHKPARSPNFAFSSSKRILLLLWEKTKEKQRWSTDWTKWTKTVFIRWNRHLVIAKFSEFDMFNTLNDITVGFSQMAFIFLVPWGHCTTGKSRQSQKSVLMWVWYLFWWFSSHFRLHKVSSDTPSRLNLTCGLYLTQPFVPLGSGALIFLFSLWFDEFAQWLDGTLKNNIHLTVGTLILTLLPVLRNNETRFVFPVIISAAKSGSSFVWNETAAKIRDQFGLCQLWAVCGS